MSAGDLAGLLTKRDLARLLALVDDCLGCTRDEDFDRLVLRVAELAGCEFALYAYMESGYDRNERVHLVNLTNPPRWMQEYDERGYLQGDPVRVELEHRLARGEAHGLIVWDAYERPLSAREQEIIARRTHYGLRYGLSAFCDSPRHDAVFVVSLASGRPIRGRRAPTLGELIVPHLNRCRKRLDLLHRLERLTRREQAVAQWLVTGKTNWEIARILGVTEATAKYHVANILAKLGADSRQSAVAVLIAERYLA
ncbi:MAG TPA: LuxR C-terminal-related transcriptional regulator [Polyangia bacterium]